jgi:fructokinase
MFPDGRQLGGAVANVAFHLAQLGAEVQLVSRIGDDELGREALTRLDAVGVDTSLVQVDPERPTGQVNVELEDGEPRYSLSAHAAWEYIEMDDQAAAALQRASFMSVGTLAQRRAEGRASMHAAARARGQGCKLVVDANVRPVHLDHDWLGDLLRRSRKS